MLMGRGNTLQCVSSALLEAPAECGVGDFNLNESLPNYLVFFCITQYFFEYGLFAADNVVSVLREERVSLPTALIPSVEHSPLSPLAASSREPR